MARLHYLGLGRRSRREEASIRAAAKRAAVATSIISSETGPVSSTLTPPLIKRLVFFAGAKSVPSLPPAKRPEVAFAGRSNVGKSTLINSIGRSPSAARVSDKPGHTQSINFYRVDAAPAAGGRGPVLVDMPGYGFAFAQQQTIDEWGQLMDEYYTKRKRLRRVFLLLDGRHGAKQIDLEFMAYLDRVDVPYSCVLTKCDLVASEDLARRAAILEVKLAQSRCGVNEVLLVSRHSDLAVRHLQKVVLALGR